MLTPDYYKTLAKLGGLQANPSRRFLSYGDFAAGNQAANRNTQVAAWRVPSLSLAVIEAEKPFRFLIRGHHQFAAAGGAPETFDLSANGFTSGIAQNPAGDATSVVVLVNGAVTAPAAIDYANGTVDVNTAAADTVDIYALPLDGHAELRAIPADSGAGTPRAPSIFAQPFSQLNTVSQADARYAPKLHAPEGARAFGPAWLLAIYANTPVTIDWSSAYAASLHIPVVMFDTGETGHGLTDHILAGFYR